MLDVKELNDSFNAREKINTFRADKLMKIIKYNVIVDGRESRRMFMDNYMKSPVYNK